MARSAIISLEEHQAVLLDIDAPYNALSSTPFDIRKRFIPFNTHRELPLNQAIPGLSNGKGTAISVERQYEMFKECLDTFDGGAERGWTMFVSSPSYISTAEYLAAYMCGMAAKSGFETRWLDVGKLISKDLAAIQEEDVLFSQRKTKKLVVLTGLRATGDASAFRWDKAFDILRVTRQRACRIVVAGGADPITVSRKLGLPANKALFLAQFDMAYLGKKTKKEATR